MSTVWQERGFANKIFHTDPSLSQSLPCAQFFIKVDGSHLETAEANLAAETKNIILFVSYL